MKIKQLPCLASALAMTAGLYLLADPFDEVPSTLFRHLMIWGVLLAYELLVIGAIALLRLRDVPAGALTAVSLFFLADPVFLGDSSTSISVGLGMTLNSLAWIVSGAKAWLLSRALRVKITPWQAVWAAGALGFICLFPSLMAMPATRSTGFSNYYWGGCWTASAIVAAIPRSRKFLWALAGGITLHFLASGFVLGATLEVRLFTPPLLAAAVLLPYARLSWAPALAALLCSPLRPALSKSLGSRDGLGILLVAVAFILLAIGFIGHWPGRIKGLLGRSPAGPARQPHD